MGFTNVAWESRSTVQLARDLTDGPGPITVGQAGASWIRVANELSRVAEEYTSVIEVIRGSASGQGVDAVVTRLDQLREWLQAASLSAAANGQRAEEAAVAHSAAILAMPTVSEAIEVKTEHDIMASLAAYNGVVLNGRFAEIDQAASEANENASAVMYKYEQACEALAAPWDQPPPPEVSNGAALRAESDSESAGAVSDGAAGHGSGATSGLPPAPLAPFRPDDVKASSDPKELRRVAANNPSGANSMGLGRGGYGPMAAMGRSDNSREHQSSTGTTTLDGGGEPGASISQTGTSWLPMAQQTTGPFVVSHVSWGPSSSAFDNLAGPNMPDEPQYATEPSSNLDRLSNRWIARPVIGDDAERTL